MGKLFFIFIFLFSTISLFLFASPAHASVDITSCERPQNLPDMDLSVSPDSGDNTTKFSVTINWKNTLKGDVNNEDLWQQIVNNGLYIYVVNGTTGDIFATYQQGIKLVGAHVTLNNTSDKYTVAGLTGNNIDYFILAIPRTPPQTTWKNGDPTHGWCVYGGASTVYIHGSSGGGGGGGGGGNGTLKEFDVCYTDLIGDGKPGDMCSVPLVCKTSTPQECDAENLNCNVAHCLYPSSVSCSSIGGTCTSLASDIYSSCDKVTNSYVEPIFSCTSGQVCCAPDSVAIPPVIPTATPAPPPPPCLTDPQGNCIAVATGLGSVAIAPSSVIGSIFGILLSFAGGIVLIIIIFAGYRLMTSQGDPEKLKGAREMLTAAIIGLLFIIFSVTILEIIGVNILHLPGFTPGATTLYGGGGGGGHITSH